VGRRKGLHGKEGGSHSLGCPSSREESWWIGTIVRVKPGFWASESGEWTTKRVGPPYGLIGLAWGWPSIKRNITTMPMAGRNVPCTWPVGSTINK
jgi:hypothetical protein